MTETRIDDAVGLDDFQLLDPGVQQCPHLYYASMREDTPVFATEVGGTPILLVTRYQDVLDIIRDTETFSSNTGSGTSMPVQPELAEEIRKLYRTEGGYERVGTMLTIDPPEQTRYRKLVSRSFTVRAVSDLEPAIREVAGGLIARWVNDGKVEFVRAFAVPLPVATIARALNVPDDRLDDFKRWTNAIVALASGSAKADPTQTGALEELGELFGAMREIVRERSARPQDDLVSAIVDPAHGKSLSELEVINFVVLLLAAGNETTTNLIGNATNALLAHPEELAKVNADPSRIPGMLEEVLRYDPPVQLLYRNTTCDVVLSGREIPAGSIVVPILASANRDESRFPKADCFDVERDAKGHIAFGFGVHFCLGASLARLEAKLAMRSLVPHLPGLRRASPHDLWLDSSMVRGRSSLELVAA